MQFKGIWWLNAIGLESNEFRGKVFEYQSVWGTGAALVGLYPSDLLKKRWNEIPQGNIKQLDKTGAIDSQKAALQVGPYPHAREEGDFIFYQGLAPEEDTNNIPGLKRWQR